jgi:hypothetical protein
VLSAENMQEIQAEVDNVLLPVILPDKDKEDSD